MEAAPIVGTFSIHALLKSQACLCCWSALRLCLKGGNDSSPFGFKIISEFRVLVDAAGFVLCDKKNCRDSSLALCVINEILLLQSPGICLGLVLFGLVLFGFSPLFICFSA